MAASRWQFEGVDGWQNFGETQQRQLEAALVSGRHALELHSGLTRYNIDLRQMVQVNPSTGTRRQVRAPPAALEELRLAPAGRDPDAAAEKLTALLRGSEERPAPLVLRVRAAGAAIPSAVGAALAAQAQGAGTLHAVQTGLAAARGGARAGPEVVLQLRSTEAARRARAARWRSIVDGAAAAGEGAAMPKPNLLRLMKDFRLVERALREQSPVPSCGLVHCEPIEDSLLDWEVGMRFPDDSVLQRGLQHLADLGRDAETHLTLRVRFPLGYPASPPEVWVQRPRLIHRSAPVTFGGKMCNELLSVAGWRPESTALQVLEGVQLGFLSSDTQVDCSVPWRVPYLRPHPVLERLKTELISTENNFVRPGVRVLSPSVAGMDCLEASDRIGLPESYLQEIVQAGEQFRGPLLFEVKTRLGRKRHCSVAGQFFPDLLPGHAILPRWVMDDLAIAEAEEVTLRQVSLDLVSFVRIQAHSACFYDAARGHNIPALLKESLVRCSALTEDTCVQVFVDGQSFQFQVVELQPKAAVRLIDTNMEEYFEFKVDFEAPPDEEDEAKRRSYQERCLEQQRAREQELRRQAEDLQARLEAAREALLRAERQRLAGLAAAGGVAAAAGATVEVALKLPDGTRMRERFREGTALAAVALLALESDWARSVCPCGVQLSCPGLRAASMELEAPITRDMHRSQLNAAPVRAPDDSELLRIGVDVEGREQLPRAHEGAADTAGDAAARPPGPPRLERQVSLVQRRTLEAFEAQRFVQAGIPPEEALRRVREGESLPPSAASLRRGAAASAQPALGRTSSQEDLVQQVVEFTAVSRELAAQRLEEAGWNVQEAINAILSRFGGESDED